MRKSMAVVFHISVYVFEEIMRRSRSKWPLAIICGFLESPKNLQNNFFLSDAKKKFKRHCLRI